MENQSEVCVVGNIFPWASAPVEPCWFPGVFQDFRGDGVEHCGGTAAVEKGQQPSHMSGGVHGFGVSRQQSVKHVVHHRGQVLRHLLGHCGQVAGEGEDVRLPIILSDVRGNGCEDLVSVASDVVTVTEDIWREET